METKTTTIKGLAIDVVVVETVHRDASGKHIWYVATIYIRERKTGVQKLIRRTRVPGSGQELARAVQQRGVRALDGFAA
ncbi:hypothetical protein [Rhizobium ruizarguesonis]|uniref:hypothetical protein n=1 Tax=Rhizobium ruizarguesonis TaxID=2081791 RepID=UPI00103180CC|nr:hypothetical protein [Rhizobium ruizarguesonis]TBD12081.1 hypothetical protein ELH23_30245 [Rhizobium ruizarguesonis]